MKKIISFFLILAMSVSMTACGNNGGDSNKVVIADGEWYGTDPYQVDSWTSPQCLISDPLFSLDPETGALNDSIATALEVSDDGKTMSFVIPHGKKFASGEELLAEDIKASLEYGSKVSPYAEGWENIKSIDIDNKSGEVNFHLSRFNTDLLYNLAECFIGILDKDQIDSMSQEELLWGAQPYGPFYVEEHEVGSYATLKRNEGYKSDNPYVKNKGASAVEEIQVKYNIDPLTITEEMKSGSCDYWTSPTNDAIEQFTSSDNVTVKKKSYPNIYYLCINTDAGSIFEDKRLREAFSLLIDREKCCDFANGRAKPAYSIIIDSMMSFSKKAENDYKANFCDNESRALKLIDDAGWSDSDNDGYLDKNGKIFEFELIDNDWYTYSKEMSQIVQEQLKKYGIKVDITSLEGGYHKERMKADDYDVAWGCYEWMDPTLILNNMYCDPDYVNGGDNSFQWFYDDIVEASSEIDAAKRIDMFGNLELEFAKEWNCIPISTIESYISHSERLKGINIFKNSYLYWNDIGIE